MEFLFLIERVWPEILIFLALLAILLFVAGQTLYLRLKAVGSVFRRKPKLAHHHIEKPQDTREIETPDIVEKVETPTPETPPLPEANIEPMPDSANIEKLVALTASARTLIARGMFVEARALIVEGLSLDKHHRELNLMLGQIYEQEWHYEKAEYVYKDIAGLHANDVEVLEKLGNILIIEKKYTIASEIYKKILSIAWETEETLYMLTHISNTLGDAESADEYAMRYIRQWPKNPDILLIAGNAEIALWKRKTAIETFKTLKNLTPYNAEIAQILQKLLVEEELAGNFWEK